MALGPREDRGHARTAPSRVDDTNAVPWAAFVRSLVFGQPASESYTTLSWVNAEPFTFSHVITS